MSGALAGDIIDSVFRLWPRACDQAPEIAKRSTEATHDHSFSPATGGWS